MQAAFPFLSSEHHAAVHEAASRLLLSLARLDQDAVWLILFESASKAAVGGCASPAGSIATPSPGLHAFPPLRQLLPTLLPASLSRRTSGRGVGGGGGGVEGATCAAAGWGVSAELAADCAPRAQALLAQIEAGQSAAWHTSVSLLMPNIGAF